MYAFIAIVCADPDDHFYSAADRLNASLGRKADWRQSAQGSMIRAWDNSKLDIIEDVATRIDATVVFGSIYQNPPGNGFRSFNADSGIQSSSVIRDSVYNIAMGFWGSYVAIKVDNVAGIIAIMRDPAGGLPCFVVKYKSCYIFFSRLQDVIDALDISLSLNIQYIIDSVTLRGLCKKGTGIEEIDEVLPGEIRYITTAGCEAHFYWNPQHISGLQIEWGYEVAAGLVGDTIKHVVSILSRSTGPALHSLGGLDSSIVLSQLVEIGFNDVHPFTLFTTEPMGDERTFARSNAAFFDLIIEEFQMCTSRVSLDRLSSVPRQPLPPEHFDCSILAGNVLEFSELHKANSIWTGFGGDNVFFRFPEVIPASDMFSASIPLARAPMYLLDVARCGHESVYRTFLAACEDRLLKKPCLETVMRYMGAGGANSLFTKAALAESGRTCTLHPMLQLPARFPKGKGHHILTTAFVTLDPYDPWLSDGARHVQRISPLLSQPVIECFLALPLWILLRYGVDRALARRVYKYRIPPEVVKRIGKCDPSSFYDKLYKENREFIRETVLDGRLSSLGLIDRVKAEKLFSRFQANDSVVSMIALDTFNLETWASHWN